VVDPVKELLQIKVNHPAAAFLDVRLGSLDRLPSIAARPEPIAVFGEARFELRLENLQQRLLYQTIQYRRDAQRTYPAVGLGYFHFANRCRHVVASQQGCPDAGPVLLQPCLELQHAESIDSGRTLVPHDTLIRSPQVSSVNHGLHLPQPFRFRLPIRRRAGLGTRTGHRRNPFASLRFGRSCLLCCVVALHRDRMS
jgi:hypothetical protein